MSRASVSSSMGDLEGPQPMDADGPGAPSSSQRDDPAPEPAVTYVACGASHSLALLSASFCDSTRQKGSQCMHKLCPFHNSAIALPGSFRSSKSSAAGPNSRHRALFCCIRELATLPNLAAPACHLTDRLLRSFSCLTSRLGHRTQLGKRRGWTAWAWGR